ncbi:MAG: pilus assembly protein [Acidimicrobiales bacterium]|nr:pilus assembly protein [Acidimicrobiales bacterium]
MLMPVLILLVMLPVQVGLWWHAKQAAEVAAEEAVDAAKIATATTADGEAGAAAILSQAGNLRNVTVTVSRTAETVTVDVQGELGFSVFPGGWSVHAHAEAPVERFIPEPER